MLGELCRLLRRPVVMILATALCVASSDYASLYGDFFAEDTVLQIQIHLSDGDWAAMSQCQRSQYHDSNRPGICDYHDALCTLSLSKPDSALLLCEDAPCEVRRKGEGSWRDLDDKPPLKVKVKKDACPGAPRKLSLNNLVQDATRCSERLAYTTHRILAKPFLAIHANSARVTLRSNSYAGEPLWYTNVETPNSREFTDERRMGLLELAPEFSWTNNPRAWYTPRLNLFVGWCPMLATPKAVLSNMWEVERYAPEDDKKTLTPTILDDAVCPDGRHRGDLSALFSVFDRTSYLVYLAWVLVTWHHDGFTQNFRLAYKEGKLHIIPSGTDQTFLRPCGTASQFDLSEEALEINTFSKLRPWFCPERPDFYKSVLQYCVSDVSCAVDLDNVIAESAAKLNRSRSELERVGALCELQTGGTAQRQINTLFNTHRVGMMDGRRAPGATDCHGYQRDYTLCTSDDDGKTIWTKWWFITSLSLGIFAVLALVGLCLYLRRRRMVRKRKAQIPQLILEGCRSSTAVVHSYPGTPLSRPPLHPPDLH